MKRFLLSLSVLFILMGFNVYADNNVYIEATKALNEKTMSISKELNDFTDYMIKSGKCTNEQKQLYDNKIKDYESYIKSSKNSVWVKHISGGAMPAVSYLNPSYENIKIDNFDDSETGITYYDKYYIKAYRRYACNVALYLNGWRNLPAYLANYSNKANGIYYLDNMRITKYSDKYIELDLANAKDYSIVYGSDITPYGYGYIKLVSPLNNTYYFTGFTGTGDWNGYFQPTGKGMELNCEYSGRKRFLLNTENRPSLVKNEAVMLSDIFFNQYLKQSKVNWSKKGIYFSGKSNVYTIKINIPKSYKVNTVSAGGNIHEYYDEFSSGSGAKGWTVISVNNGQNEYYWESDNKENKAIETAIDEYNNLKITYKDKIVYVNIVRN